MSPFCPPGVCSGGLLVVAVAMCTLGRYWGKSSDDSCPGDAPPGAGSAYQAESGLVGDTAQAELIPKKKEYFI